MMPEHVTGRVVILTALPLEYEAVRAHLTGLREETHKGTVYEHGQFSPRGKRWEVLIAQINAGNSGAAAEAERAIDYFGPYVAFFVGVAGGLKDVQIGDVVASTKVYGYESGRVEEGGFRPRPSVGESSYRLTQRASAEARKKDWLKRIRKPSSTVNVAGNGPRVLVGPIAAGEKVVASQQTEVAKLLKEVYGDALAVEMEGRGFLQATHANEAVQALIIRGISDRLDGKREADASNSQELAACNASAFAFEMLAKLDLPEGASRATASSSAPSQPAVQPYEAATGERPALFGLLLDASRHMRAPLQVGGSSTRWEEALSALNQLVVHGVALATDARMQTVAPLFQLLCYGYGFQEEIYRTGGRAAPGGAVRDLLAHPLFSTSPTAGDLASHWPDYRKHMELRSPYVGDLFGETPLCQALTTFRDRFQTVRGAQNLAQPALLVIISSGPSSDGNPEALCEELRSLGVIVCCCYLGASESVRKLYASPQLRWSSGALEALRCASPLPRAGGLGRELRSAGWQVEADARLWAQVDRVEELALFLEALLRGRLANVR